MMFTPDPCFNEPGYEGIRGTDEGDVSKILLWNREKFCFSHPLVNLCCEMKLSHFFIFFARETEFFCPSTWKMAQLFRNVKDLVEERIKISAIILWEILLVCRTSGTFVFWFHFLL